MRAVLALAILAACLALADGQMGGRPRGRCPFSQLLPERQRPPLRPRPHLRQRPPLRPRPRPPRPTPPGCRVIPPDESCSLVETSEVIPHQYTMCCRLRLRRAMFTAPGFGLPQFGRPDMGIPIIPAPRPPGFGSPGMGMRPVGGFG